MPRFHRVGRAREAALGAARVGGALGPVVPGVPGGGALAERGELAEELAPAGDVEAAADPHVVERAGLVVQAEQERAHHGARALLVPAEAGHRAVGGAGVLHLHHRPLAGLVPAVEPLGHHPVQPRSLEAAEPVRRHGGVARRRGEVQGRPALPAAPPPGGRAARRAAPAGGRGRPAPGGRRAPRWRGAAARAAGPARRPGGCGGGARSKSRPDGPATTTSPSATQRGGSCSRSGAASSGK